MDSYNRGHKVEGVWVFGMVERSPERKIRLLAVEDREAELLDRIMSQNVPMRALYTATAEKATKT